MAQNIVVVGGGIAGLATAYYTEKAAKEQGLDVKVTVVERDARLGGKVLTDETDDGFVIEGGPDSFITQKPWGLQLVRELGLADNLLGTNDERRNVYILRNGKLHQMPDGLMLVVPTEFLPFAKSRLLSWRGKMRMGMELFIKPSTINGSDISLADFMRRRLGKEALEVLVEPMMAGIHVADAEKLSLKATFPRFIDIERKYGSLTKGMLAAKKMRAEAKKKNPDSSLSMFMTLKGGLKKLIAALEDALEGEIITGQAVMYLDKDSESYTLTLQDGRKIAADSVILATPSFVAANLLQSHDNDLVDLLNGIRYVDTATVSLGYEKENFPHPLNGFGFVIPRSEPTRILACTWTSTKFDHRAPEEHVLLRAFIGGPRRQELVQLSEEELVKLVREELETIMGIDVAPKVARVFRWIRSNPQYDVGHLDRVGQMEELCPPGIYLTGSAYRGVGIPDCVHQGQLTAEKVVAGLAVKA